MLTQGGCRRGGARLQILAQWTWGQGSSRVLVILWTSKVFSSDGALVDEVLYVILMWTPPHLHPPHVHWHHSRDPWSSPFFTALPCIILNANWRPEKKANHSCEWDPVICVQPACCWITTLKHVTIVKTYSYNWLQVKKTNVSNLLIMVTTWPWMESLVHGHS